METIREHFGRLSLDVAQLTTEAIQDMLADPEIRAKLPFATCRSLAG
jgi:hypothetical protein